MNLGELITDARIRLRDKLTPYLWSDEELIIFANESVEEACIRARFLRGRYATTITAGVSSYTLPVTVLRVDEAYFVSAASSTTNAGTFTVGNWYIIAAVGSTDFTLIGAAANTVGVAFRATGVGSGTGTAYPSTVYRLEALSQPQFAEVDNACPTAASVPTYITTGDATNELLITPPPSTSGVLFTELRRTPLATEQLEDIQDVPVIPEWAHKSLVYWMLAQAYDVDDADKGSERKYNKNLGLFEARFGRRPSARCEIMGQRYGVGKDVYPVEFGR